MARPLQQLRWPLFFGLCAATAAIKEDGGAVTSLRLEEGGVQLAAGEANVAICITGEPRSFPETDRNLHTHVLDSLAPGNTHIFMAVPAGAWPEDLVSKLQPHTFREQSADKEALQQLAESGSGSLRRVFSGQHMGSPLVPPGDAQAWQTFVMTLRDQADCLQLIEEAEKQRGSQYEWLVRLRVDVAWDADAPPVKLPPAQPPAVHLPAMYSYGGPCDKFVVGPRLEMGLFFSRLTAVLALDAPDGVATEIGQCGHGNVCANSEWVLGKVLELQQVKVVPHEEYKICKFGDFSAADVECTNHIRSSNPDFAGMEHSLNTALHSNITTLTDKVMGPPAAAAVPPAASKLEQATQRETAAQAQHDYSNSSLPELCYELGC